jgi:curved DNA-binding protein CbpA
MSFQIDQGLFKLDVIDHHAILGVPLNVDTKQVRRPYLKIARRLHPDSCASEGDAAKQQASEILSKLVNPAYELLSNDREAAEYLLLLKLKGQQLQRQSDTVQLSSEAARTLVSAANVEHTYKAALQKLTEQQYQSLDHVLEVTGQISELNLVYLMRTAGITMESKKTPAGASATTSDQTESAATDQASQQAYKPSAPGAAPPRRSKSLLENYLRRAEEFEMRQDYPKAILELREALQTHPKSADCHSRLGNIYLKTKQATMAKIHFNKALELDPQNEVALAGKRQLEGTSQGASRKNTATQKKSSNDQDKPKGGLFGLFGGKKK